MGENKILLTPNDILQKEFTIDVRGFRPQEVDEFLDRVIKDYDEFNKIIKRQEREMKLLTEDNTKLKQEIRRLKMIIENAEESTSTQTRSVNNVDLLRRISQLEKVVYGKDE